jgi:hypothetical protein
LEQKKCWEACFIVIFSVPKAQPGTISFPPDFIGLPYEKGYSGWICIKIRREVKEE